MARVDTFGTPGEYARKLMFKALVKVAQLAVLAGVLFVVAWKLNVTGVADDNRSVKEIFAAVLAVAGVVVAAFIPSYWSSMRKAEIGWRSEKRVAGVLAKVNATAVIHGALLGAGGDVDHVVLGPTVVAVETKTGGGRVSAANNKMTAGRRVLPKDPIAQVLRQAKALSRMTNCSASAVVVVCDMTNRPFKHRGVVVCSLRDLPSVIKSQPAQLSTSQARQLASQIYENLKNT